MKLWDKVEKLAQGSAMTNYWKSYKEMVPTERLAQTKAETFTVES